uniref:PIN domain-containing protein n=1 Tax=Agathobacter sp. TaxID=2021311 RepID=UPI0040574288
MRYVMMDTNIFIDMIIDRKHNVSGKLVESFIKLLDFDEIKLIIPAIVVHETNKHIEEQLAEVGKKIKSAINSLDDIYGINGYEIDGLEIKEYKNNSRKQLTELFTKYESNKSDYLREIKAIIKKIFEHPNCIIVEDTEQLRSLCLQRRIYKRAPFHYEKKESYADGLIVETLVHLSDYITLGEEDNIIFVTGNTSDFSKRIQKKELHEDIYEDLEKIGLGTKVKYITSFGELIGKELKQEVENANLKEEFEKEMQEQEEMNMEQLYADVEDMERESVGLTALGSFEEEFLESFSESHFVEQLKELFERINNCFSNLEDIEYFYTEELQDHVCAVEAEKIAEFIEKWNELMDDLEETPVLDDISGIREIIDWIEQKANSSDYSDVNVALPDSIEYGDNIIIYGVDKKQYELRMDELYLSCGNGDIDWLNIVIYHAGEKCASGNIEITYGFVDFDDDGGIGDACDEDISYQTGGVIEYIEEIVNEFEAYVNEELGIVETIRNYFDM